LCGIAEEIGRACAPVPIGPSIYLAAEAIKLFGSPRQKNRWLPGLVSGDLIGTAVLDRRPSGLAFEDGQVTGVLGLVPSGYLAGVVVALAREADGAESVVVVDCTAAEIERRHVGTIDDSLPQAEMVFRGCPAERLAGRGEGAALSRRVLDGAAVLVAFEQIGGADACLEMARAYAMERRTFGRIVASYQAIKHRLVDIYVKNEIARSNAYFAAWALSEDRPELAAAAAAARLSATEAFEFASAENIQIHGGMGFTWEADPHLYYRRSRSLALGLGPATAWQSRLMQALAT
jgi:alkylation response protein AidB-like acyl-CoA dehydrogenase